MALNLTQSKLLLNRTVTSATKAVRSSVRVQSLLNPDNIHEYFFDYSLGKYEDIKKRFALNSNQQVDAMHDYLIDATVVFLQ